MTSLACGPPLRRTLWLGDRRGSRGAQGVKAKPGGLELLAVNIRRAAKGFRGPCAHGGSSARIQSPRKSRWDGAAAEVGGSGCGQGCAVMVDILETGNRDDGGENGIERRVPGVCPRPLRRGRRHRAPEDDGRIRALLPGQGHRGIYDDRLLIKPTASVGCLLSDADLVPITVLGSAAGVPAKHLRRI